MSILWKEYIKEEFDDFLNDYLVKKDWKIDKQKLINSIVSELKDDIIKKITSLEEEKKLISFDGLEHIKKIDKILNILNNFLFDIQNNKIKDLNKLNNILKIIK